MLQKKIPFVSYSWDIRLCKHLLRLVSKTVATESQDHEVCLLHLDLQISKNSTTKIKLSFSVQSCIVCTKSLPCCRWITCVAGACAPEGILGWTRSEKGASEYISGSARNYKRLSARHLHRKNDLFFISMTHNDPRIPKMTSKIWRCHFLGVLVWFYWGFLAPKSAFCPREHLMCLKSREPSADIRVFAGIFSDLPTKSLDPFPQHTHKRVLPPHKRQKKPKNFFGRFARGWVQNVVLGRFYAPSMFLIVLRHILLHDDAFWVLCITYVQIQMTCVKNVWTLKHWERFRWTRMSICVLHWNTQPFSKCHWPWDSCCRKCLWMNTDFCELHGLGARAQLSALSMITPQTHLPQKH